MYWFFIALWPIVYLLFSNIYSFQNKSIIFNLISAFHSFGCFYLSLITYHDPNEYNYQRLALFSASYFIWDSFKLILKNKNIYKPNNSKETIDGEIVNKKKDTDDL